MNDSLFASMTLKGFFEVSMGISDKAISSNLI